MTQAPQAVPAGWYPSPDGAPVHRWWDGTMWTDATHPPQAPAQDQGIFGSLGSTNSGDSEYAKKMQANPTLEH